MLIPMSKMERIKLTELTIDILINYGIISIEVKPVLVKVLTVQTCGDWEVFFLPE